LGASVADNSVAEMASLTVAWRDVAKVVWSEMLMAGARVAKMVAMKASGKVARLVFSKVV